jgi:hypothetical protein
MRRPSAKHVTANGATPVPPIAPALAIDPNGVYRPEVIQAALGLGASALRAEWRRGALRIIRRCNRNFILGRDVLRWLDAGELPSPAHRHNGPPR